MRKAWARDGSGERVCSGPAVLAAAAADPAEDWNSVLSRPVGASESPCLAGEGFASPESLRWAETPTLQKPRM